MSSSTSNINSPSQSASTSLAFHSQQHQHQPEMRSTGSSGFDYQHSHSHSQTHAQQATTTNTSHASSSHHSPSHSHSHQHQQQPSVSFLPASAYLSANRPSTANSYDNSIQSLPQTAATSMLTVCPDDEKDNIGIPVFNPNAAAAAGVDGLENSGPSGRDGEGDGEQLTNGEGNNGSTGNGNGSGPPPVPQVALTFLLVSGTRRTMTFDPETTVGRVKELVWNGWPPEWQEEKPPAPNFLRVLYLGKILQDEDTLSSLQLPTTYLSSSSAGQPPSPTSAVSPAPPSPTSPITPTHASPSNPRRSRLSTQFPQPTIVHLSIRPYAPPAEDEALIKKNLRAARRALSRSGSTVQPPVNGAPGAAGEEVGRGCCGCVIC